VDISAVQKAFNRSRHNSTDLGLKFPKSLLGKLYRLTALHRRSFYRSRKIDTWSVDPGFRLQGLLTAGFSASPSGAASAERLRRSQNDFVERLREMPGVEAVTLASNRPMEQLRSTIQIHKAEVTLTAEQQTVGSEFFQTMGITLLSGREFNARDNASTPKVAIVNEKLAARLWPVKILLDRA
jgi:hypothetical protein